MPPTGSSVEKERTAPAPDDPRKPDSPPALAAPSWRFATVKAIHEFSRDKCTDLAAGLTYYSVLALFPGLVALVSLLGVFGDGPATTAAMLDMMKTLAPPDIVDQLRGPIDSMVNTKAAGLGLVTGLLGALWSASGYVGAFGRAMNRIYEVDEGRPVWKLRPIQFALTLAITVMVALVLVGLVVSGPIAEGLASTLGLGPGALQVVNFAKWPIMLALVVLIVALLYYVTPNVQQPKLRWVSLGAVIAIVIWIAGSAGFGFYVANFGSYNKTYGTLAGVIVFLLWLWLTNVALLFGAEVDAEVERARQLQARISAEEIIQLPPRDTKGSKKAMEKHEEKIEEARRIRLAAEEARSADVPAGRRERGEKADS